MSGRTRMAAKTRTTHPAAPRIHVLAGVNGAGKSSIGGAAIRAFDADYFNPDEAARALRLQQPNLDVRQANALAWQQGKRLLEKAIAERLDFAFETTLGGSTIPKLLSQAAENGFEVRIWYVGLASAELHIERVRARVLAGGHEIAEVDIRRRWQHSRLNLIALLRSLAELRVYDNSEHANPLEGHAPKLRLVLHLSKAEVLGPDDLAKTPVWAKPIVAAALKRQTG